GAGRALRHRQRFRPLLGYGPDSRRGDCVMASTGRRVLRATRILTPLVMFAGALFLLASPAGAVDLTSPGETLADAPQKAVTQATGVQPAAPDPGTPTDNMPACATVGDETDPIKCLPI